MNLRKKRSSIVSSKKAEIEAILLKGRKTLKDYFIANRAVRHGVLAERLTKRTGIKVTMLEIISWREDSFDKCHAALGGHRRG